MNETVAIYPEPVLRGFATNFLLALGAPREEANVVADGLMTACLWWHPGQGQGLEKLLRYHRRVGNGGIVPGIEMEWVRASLLDARKGFGYVAAHREEAALLSQLEFLIRAHSLRHVVLIAHQDCAYYSSRLSVSHLNLASRQAEDLAKAAVRVRDLGRHLDVSTFFAHVSGDVVDFEQLG